MKPTIRILLYTDHPTGITGGEESFGLGVMRQHLKAHAPTFATLSDDWVSRYSRTGSVENKLDALLKPGGGPHYDQVWFFGTYQGTRANFSPEFVRGGPESELVQSELEVLREWMSVGAEKHMRGGGVLMTGDHNQKLVAGTLPGAGTALCPNPDPDAKVLGLGRALGRCVPRAGRLRKWEGVPTSDAEDSFNTQAPVPDFDINSQILQGDALPQQLFPLRFNDKGQPSPKGKPHPLLFYRDGRWIQFFPDHAHEGAIVLPEEKEFEDLAEWPASEHVQPRPRVVARGIDHRRCTMIDLLAAYNGDCAGVGRVVADSTWHHYLNINLTNFPHPSDVETPADHIGQFYGNLATWLTPRSTRRVMAREMFCWLARHPFMLEEVGGDVLNIGRAAYAALLQETSACEINELLDAAVPAAHRKRYEAIYFTESEGVLSPFPSKMLLLGSIVNAYHGKMIEAETACDEFDPSEADELINTGFREALREHEKLLSPVASEAAELVKLKP